MKKNVISIATFLVFIYGLTVFNFLKEPVAFSENENRTLQQMPNFTVESLLSGEFNSKFEKFITDQFIFRDEFIQLKTETEVLTGKTQNKGVYIGADGYLLQQIVDLNTELLEKNITSLKKFAEKNPDAKFLLVPNSTHILSDKLPAFANPYDQLAMLESIKNAVGENNFIDASSTLFEHKDEYIYYKTDHHYTSLGAFYTANAYLKALGLEEKSKDDFEISDVTKNFFGTLYSQAPLLNITSDTITKYDDGKNYSLDYNMGQYQKDSFYDESFLETKDKYAYFLGGNSACIKVTSENKNGKKLMLIKDSYANSFLPFIADQYEEIHVIDLRYMNMSIEKYKQDNEITDILVLYNTQGFTTDTTVYKMTF